MISITKDASKVWDAKHDPVPVLQPGYVYVKVGDMVTVTTTRPVVLGQGLDNIENALEMPKDADFTLFADKVTFRGEMSAPGRHILIVARSIAALADRFGAPALLSVDGINGEDIDPYTTRAADGPLPEQLTGMSVDKIRELKLEFGRAGKPGQNGEAGEPGKPGSAAGSIQIYCWRAEEPLALQLSAVGGKGGAAKPPQAGGNGGQGVIGSPLMQVPVLYPTIPHRTVDLKTATYSTYFPSPGGIGGQAGRGGQGASAGAGGQGGTIIFSAGHKYSALPAEERVLVSGGDPGAVAWPGPAGKPGSGGQGGDGGKLAGDTAVGLGGKEIPRGPTGPEGQSDGNLLHFMDPTTRMEAWEFRAASAKFVSEDVNNLLEIVDKGFFRIEQLVSPTSVRLAILPPGTYTSPVSAGSSLRWRLHTVKPWYPAYQRIDGKADDTTTFRTGPGFMHGESALFIAKHGFYEIRNWEGRGDFVLDREVPAGDGLVYVQLEGPKSRSGESVNPEISKNASLAGTANYVSDDYLYMQVDRARFAYMSADTTTLALHGRDPVWATDTGLIAARDAIGEASERLEWAMALIEARDSSSEQLAALYATAYAMQRSIRRGLDAFGRGPNWVPPLQYEFYQKQLNSDPRTGTRGAIDLLKSLEEQDEKNRQQAIELLQRQSNLNKLTANAKVEVAAMQDLASTANAALLTYIQMLDEQDTAVNEARKKLNEAVSRWSSETSAKLLKATITKEVTEVVTTIFDVATQIAFLPENPTGSAMAMTRSISLIGGSIGRDAMGFAGRPESEPLITGNDGQPVPIKYELKALNSFGDSVTDLKDGVKALAKKGGMLQPDVPSEMLVGYKKTFMQMFDEFSKDAGEEAKAAKGAMDAYFDAVAERNATILQYNESLSVLHMAQQRKKAAEKLAAQAQNLKAGTTTIGLAEHLVERAVDRARESCIELLYRMNRACMAYTLNPDITFHNTLKLDHAWEFDSQTAVSALGIINQNWTKAYEHSTKNASPPCRKAGEKCNQDPNQNGERWHLQRADHPRLIARLQKNGAASVKLPPAHLDAASGPFTKANIHLSLVRCWLSGATSKTGIVRLKLVHRGDDIFVNKQDMEVDLTHDPTPISLQYRVSRPEDVGTWRAVQNSDQPDIAVPVDGWIHGGDRNFFGIGPFATWEIHVLNKDEVDLSALDRVTFEFFYFFEEFEGS